MKIISNVEFEKLVEGQPAKLRALARRRLENDSQGFLTTAEVATYIDTFKYTGDSKSVQWLKNLAVLHRSGKLRRIRAGAETYTDHAEQVHLLHAAGQIPFDMGDSVQCKESGRYGSIVDYNPDTKEYVVVLSPFEMKNYKKSDIAKTAQMADDTWAQEEVMRWVMNDYTLYQTTLGLIESGASSMEVGEELSRLIASPVNMQTMNLSHEELNSIDWESLADEAMSYLENDVQEVNNPEEF